MMSHLAFGRGVFAPPAASSPSKSNAMSWEHVYFAVDGELCILSEGEAIGDFIARSLLGVAPLSASLPAIEARLRRMYETGMRLSQVIPRRRMEEEEEAVGDSSTKGDEVSPAVDSMLMEMRAILLLPSSTKPQRKTTNNGNDDEDDESSSSDDDA